MTLTDTIIQSLVGQSAAPVISPVTMRIVLALSLGAILASLLLPAAMALSHRLGAVDHPGGRRQHARAVPRLGGVAVVLAVMLSAVLVPRLLSAPEVVSHARVLWLGAILVFAVGMLDDLVGLAPWVKLLVQFAAALLVVNDGVTIGSLALAYNLPALDIGSLAPALTVLWIVGMVNAFNLIDGMDGLAVMCSMIALATLVLTSFFLGWGIAGVPSGVFALIGALLAFYRRNRHPATVFLGDGGSMAVGFILAVGMLSIARGAEGQTYALVPLGALAYPLVDTLVAIARRWLRGHPLSRADGRHIHHQILQLGFPVPKAVGIIGFTFGLVAAMSIAIAFAPAPFVEALVLASLVITAIAVLQAIRWLGYGEFIALGKSVLSGIAKVRGVVRLRIRMGDVARHMKHSESEQELFGALALLVDGEQLLAVELRDEQGGVLACHVAELVGLDTTRFTEVSLPVARVDGGSTWRLRAVISAVAISHHAVERLASIIAREITVWHEEHAPAAVEARAPRSSPVPAPVPSPAQALTSLGQGEAA